ncbi:MAG: pyridoxal phosphate-dependent class II aminotransferase, partial [Nitrospirota bacterium]|nr:pyridoxal phosphate-dependent class II aminotransferase [Nitrospirota bacterium]
MELIRTQTSADCPLHGGNIYRMAQETGIPVEGLVDFSASINPLGVPQKAKEIIIKGLDSLVNYPDPDTTVLREKLALHHGIESETVLCGNGSTELIYLLPRALRPASVLIHAPAFSEYERACRLNHKLRITNYELKERDGLKIIPGQFIEGMYGCDMAFLCNPNNPTGDLLKKEDVIEIAEAARRLKCFLVVDEAFIDFTPGVSVIRQVRDNPYLIVLRSMTKFYALTGLRMGYAVIHASMIERVREFREPWTVNTLAQIAAAAALD